MGSLRVRNRILAGSRWDLDGIAAGPLRDHNRILARLKRDLGVGLIMLLCCCVTPDHVAN